MAPRAAMRLAWILVVSACGGHYRTEFAGQGVAAVVPRDAAKPPAAPGVAVEPGRYDVALAFELPRAQLVEWQLRCADQTIEGSLGESFDDYRARRLAQLASDAHAEASIASALVPGGRVAVRVEPAVELPPGDVGAGRVATTVHVTTGVAGTCAVSARADDAGVVGSFALTRVRDLDAEAREQIAARDRAARDARGAMFDQLAALGADPALRQQRHDAAIAIEVRRRGAALAAGHELRAYLASCGAIADRQQLIAVRERAALDARGELRAYFIIEGARARPPMPPPIDDRGESPFPGALWIEGRWTWRGAWVWVSGWWKASDAVGAQAIVAQARGGLIAELAVIGADPAAAHRAREEAELAREREQARADAVRFQAIELADQRARAALDARGELRAQLVADGARERPPMPPAPDEHPGDPPFPGASWIAGHWTWTGELWAWTAGGWSTREHFEASTSTDPSPPPVMVVTPVAVPVIVVRPAPPRPPARERPKKPTRP